MDAPMHGDKILVIRPYWLDLILAGEKTLEILDQTPQTHPARPNTKYQKPKTHHEGNHKPKNKSQKPSLSG